MSSIIALVLMMLSFVTADQSFDLAVSYNVTENQAPGSLIGDLLKDADLASHYPKEALGQIYFEILEHATQYDKFFSISNRRSLAIRTSVDRDEICRQQIHCFINLSVAIQPIVYFKIVNVALQIIDVNDNAPQFPSPNLEVEVSETAALNSQYVLPSAEDADSGIFGVQGYRLLGQDSALFQLLFTVDEGGSEDVKLVLKQTLDRETTEKYHIQLLAYDGGAPAKTGVVDISVVVGDANDNPPQFTSSVYETSVREDVPVGSTFLQVHASDADTGDNGRVSYSLAPNTDATLVALFSIDARTGALSTLAPLDHEAGDLYFLSVVARDSGVPSSLSTYSRVKVAVEDMNDHAPAVSVQALTSRDGRVQVLENAPAGTFVAQVLVTDSDSGDNGRITCSLDSAYFELREAGRDQFRVLTTVSFDREVREMYDMNLVCRDLGAQPQTTTKYVVVEVVDVNDHDPVFLSPYLTVSVYENKEIGSYVGQLNASDSDAGENARLRYEVSPPGILDVNPDTGIITTLKMLDHEIQAKYIFLVTVTDHGQPRKSATMTLTLNILDINDCAPEFSQKVYNFATFENQPRGTEIGVLVAHDIDSPPFNTFTYALDRKTPDSGYFSVNSVTGKLTTLKVLDREVKPVYHITVLARNDDYLTGSANVTIQVADKNDNSPVIRFPSEANNTIEVPTLTPVGSSISQILAYDPDSGINSALTYSIVSGNEVGYFDIIPLNGKVILKQDISKISSRIETIIIMVQDQGAPPLSSVSPLTVFFNDSAGYMANSSPGGLIGTDTTAVLIICLLVFVITIIVVILFVLLVIRPRLARRRERKAAQRYNCRTEEQRTKNNNGQEDADCDNKMNNVMAAGRKGHSNYIADHSSVVLQNPQANRPLDGQHGQQNGTNMAKSAKAPTDNCALRELQLQVYNLAGAHQYRQDPDRDSLTDSGRGPSEEGDRLSPHYHPPLPPRQPKIPCRSSGHFQPKRNLPHMPELNKTVVQQTGPPLPKRQNATRESMNGASSRHCKVHGIDNNKTNAHGSRPQSGLQNTSSSQSNSALPGRPLTHLYPYKHPLCEQQLKCLNPAPGAAGGVRVTLDNEDVESEKSYDSSTTSGSFFVDHGSEMNCGRISKDIFV